MFSKLSYRQLLAITIMVVAILTLLYVRHEVNNPPTVADMTPGDTFWTDSKNLDIPGNYGRGSVRPWPNVTIMRTTPLTKWMYGHDVRLHMEFNPSLNQDELDATVIDSCGQEKTYRDISIQYPER